MSREGGDYLEVIPIDGSSSQHVREKGDYGDVSTSSSLPNEQDGVETQSTLSGPPVFQDNAEVTERRPSFASLSPLGGSAHLVARYAALKDGTRIFGGSSKPYEPIYFCTIISRRPVSMCIFFTLFWLSFAVLTGVLIAADVDVFPLVFDRVPLDLVGDNTFLRYKAWVNAPLYVDYAKVATNLPKRASTGSLIFLIYKAGDGNVLVKERLLAIRKLEQQIQSVEGFSDWCRINPLSAGPPYQCDVPLSIVSLFDGTMAAKLRIGDKIPLDPDFDRIPQVLQRWELVAPDILDSLVGYTYNNITRRSHVLRTAFDLGLPVRNGVGSKNYTDPDQDQIDQLKFIEDWVADNMEGVLEAASVPGCRVLYMNKGLAQKATVAQVVKDLALAGGSLGFVWLYMVIQTRSFLVTASGLGGVLMAFFATNLFYRFVLGYKFFGIFHVLSVFIILGIGADDIFVFYDAWVQSKCEREEIRCSPSKRLSWTYRRSIAAISITSITTIFSFLSAANTELLAMHTFGLYSALLILFNLICVCTLLPCAIMVWDKHFVWRKVACLRWANSTPTRHISQSGPVMSYGEVPVNTAPELGKVERFFRDYWYHIVCHKKGKFVVLASFAVLLSVFIFGASQLEVDREAVKIWKPGSNWQDFQEALAKDMKPSTESARVQIVIVWGLKNQDRSVCDGPSDFQCEGRVVWDESFDLNPMPAQLEFLKLCEDIRSLKNNPNLLDKLSIKLDRSGEVELQCFMDFVEKFWRPHGFPITRGSLQSYDPSYLQQRPYNETQTYYRWFELSVATLAGLGADVNASVRTRFLDNYLGHLGAKDEREYGAQMKYTAITINTKLLYPVAFEDGLPVWYEWGKYIDQKRGSIAPSIANMWHVGRKVNGVPDRVVDSTFHWLKVQETLVATAFSGIFLGLGLALVVLIFASANLIVGFLATATIGGIVIMMLGLIYFAGWKIGVLESLNLTLVVGLAVDYVVHLAHAYVSSHCVERGPKMQEALVEVGVSIVSGATTTIGSSMFMLFAKILFFFQFGLIMFATIAFSCLFALVFFPALMATVGPQGPKGKLFLSINYGNIKRWIHHVLNAKGRRGVTVECKMCGGSGFLFQNEEDADLPSIITYRRDVLLASLGCGAITQDEYTQAAFRLRYRKRSVMANPLTPISPLTPEIKVLLSRDG